MACCHNNEGSKTTCCGYINLTAVIGIVALLVIGFIVKYEYDKGREQELRDRERARIEQEVRERESAIWQAERERNLREAEDARRRDELELAKERMAVEEQRLQAKQKAETDRLADIQALKLQAEKERLAAAAAVEERRAAAAQKAADNEARHNNQKQMSEAQLREQYEKAVKDVNDLTEKVKQAEAQVIAFKNKKEVAAKQVVALENEEASLVNAHNRPKTSMFGAKVVPDVIEEVTKVRARLEFATKEQKDSENGYNNAITERAAAVQALEAAKNSRHIAASGLKNMGLDVVEKKAAPKDQTQAAGVPSKKTFVLKDGRNIVALKVVETPEEYSIKKEDGKFEVISKETVDKIIEE